MMHNQKLYRFHYDTRYGKLEGLFLAIKEEVDNIIGKELYFGDCLGKFSEVLFTLKESHLEQIKITNEVLQELYNINSSSTIVGYSPFHHLEDKVNEDDDF